MTEATSKPLSRNKEAILAILIARPQWVRERPGVFAARVDGRVIGRVVEHDAGWEWASYRNGVTHDAGKAASLADARTAVEQSATPRKQQP